MLEKDYRNSSETAKLLEGVPTEVLRAYTDPNFLWFPPVVVARVVGQAAQKAETVRESWVRFRDEWGSLNTIVEKGEFGWGNGYGWGNYRMAMEGIRLLENFLKETESWGSWEMAGEVTRNVIYRNTGGGLPLPDNYYRPVPAEFGIYEGAAAKPLHSDYIDECNLLDYVINLLTVDLDRMHLSTEARLERKMLGTEKELFFLREIYKYRNNEEIVRGACNSYVLVAAAEMMNITEPLAEFLQRLWKKN